MGPITMDDATVEGKIIVKGPLKADDSLFKDSVDIKGSLRADECSFKNSITIEVDRSKDKKSKRNKPVCILEETTAEEIFIKGKPQEGKKLIVVLKDGTKVKKINFESEEGYVSVYGGASVDEVINGKMGGKGRPKRSKKAKKIY